MIPRDPKPSSSKPAFTWLLTRTVQHGHESSKTTGESKTFALEDIQNALLQGEYWIRDYSSRAPKTTIQVILSGVTRPKYMQFGKKFAPLASYHKQSKKRWGLIWQTDVFTVREDATLIYDRARLNPNQAVDTLSHFLHRSDRFEKALGLTFVRGFQNVNNIDTQSTQSHLAQRPSEADKTSIQSHSKASSAQSYKEAFANTRLTVPKPRLPLVPPQLLMGTLERATRRIETSSNDCDIADDEQSALSIPPRCSSDLSNYNNCLKPCMGTLIVDANTRGVTDDSCVRLRPRGVFADNDFRGDYHNGYNSSCQ